MDDGRVLLSGKREDRTGVGVDGDGDCSDDKVGGREGARNVFRNTRR